MLVYLGEGLAKVNESYLLSLLRELKLAEAEGEVRVIFR